MRKGFVVVYQAMNENMLRFSKNRIEENHILDFIPLTQQEFTFRTEFNDTIIDVLWQKMSERCLGAVICLSRIYFVNENLEVFRTFRLGQH